MTIEEKIQKKAKEYGELAQIFIEGAEFALDNQWISVDEDLPCNRVSCFFGYKDCNRRIVPFLAL